MNDLDGFAAKVAAELQAADHPSITPEQEADYMAHVEARKADYERQVVRLLEDVVRPRMQTLAGFFTNAASARKCEHGRCTWWFGYTNRFPASVKVEVSIEHDDRYENLHLGYEVSILPAYAKYERFDRYTIPFDRTDDTPLIDWLESRLIKFVRTYLTLANSDRDQTASFATDPVCGMRITRDTAAAQAQHAGHPYFFCSKSCCDSFEAEPTRYAKLVLA